MAHEVTIRTLEPQLLAAVHRRVTLGEVGGAWKPALDQVWAFLENRPELREGGHNVFLYRHPHGPHQPMDVDFGVQVIAAFEPQGEVRPVETPGGEAAVAVHVGHYDGLWQAHRDLHAWLAANGRSSVCSMEIYGDWNTDPARIETTIAYLLS